MPRTASIFFITIFAINVTVLAANSSEFAESYATTDMCSLMEYQKFEWDAGSYVTFKPLNQVRPTFPYWQLNWHGVNVAIPAISYTGIAVKDSPDNSHRVYLRSENEKMSVVLSRENYGFVDFESILGFETEENFKLFTYMGMLKNAFSVTPDNVDCQSSDKVSVLATIGSLMMKGLIVTGEDSFANDEFGEFDGVLVSYPAFGGRMAELYIQDPNSEEEVITISYISSEDSIYNTFYLLMNSAESKAETGPGWFIELERLLAESNIPGVKKLAESNHWKFTDLRQVDHEAVIQKMLDEPELVRDLYRK